MMTGHLAPMASATREWANVSAMPWAILLTELKVAGATTVSPGSRPLTRAGSK